MADNAAPKPKSGGAIRWIITGIVAIAILVFVGGLVNKYLPSSKKESSESNQTTSKKTIATITCNPTWENGAGWCDKKLPAGEYQIQLTRWDYQMAQREKLGGPITKHEAVPEQGIPIERFNSESYQAEFRQGAPRGDLAVGKPLFRINGTGTKPMSDDTFSLTEEGTLSIGLNLLPGASYYEGGTGGMVVTISQ